VSDPGAAAWLRKADDTLTKAAEQSPDSALIKRSLEEARMEQQRKGE
jgi:hypothetical protein